jgi:hypothetical protein
MAQVAAPLRAEKNNKRIKAIRPPLSSTPSTIDVLPEGSGEEGGGRFERDGRCRDKGIQLFRAVAKRCSLGRAPGDFLRILRPVRNHVCQDRDNPAVRWT